MYPLKEWTTLPRGYKFGEQTWYSKNHLGVDIICPEKTPVYAPFDGYVIRAFKGNQGGYTCWFTPYHDSVIIRFLHLYGLPPILGNVAKGDIIAYTGNTGMSTAPHLHTDISRDELKINDFTNFINPEKYNWFMPTINIQTIRQEEERHKDRITKALEKAYQWYKDRGVQINLNSNNPHFTLYTKTQVKDYNGGNAIWDKREALVFVGDAKPNLRLDRDVVIHEILHMLWFGAGLGCMHDCVGADKEEERIWKEEGVQRANEYALKKFLENYDPQKHFIINEPLYMPKDELTREEVINQYKLTRRVYPTEEEIEYWTGKRLIDMQNQMKKDDKALLEKEV